MSVRSLPFELVSESITPDRTAFDSAAMARGEMGAPRGFTWRGRHYTVAAVLETRKQSEAWNHAPGGERYLRRHCFRIRVDSGEIMNIYGVRHVKRGESARKRWWLYSIETPDSLAVTSAVMAPRTPAPDTQIADTGR